MLTNVFRLGGLQEISWFQLIPADGDVTPPFDKRQISMHSELLASKVLNAHIKLQNEGHLSAWTCYSSQSLEDVSIKLWLFLPGRNEILSTTMQSSISGLKVIGSGLWSYLKDSGEVAIALSQALRNRMERAFRGVGYMRFGDVFVKCRSFSNESQLRKPLPTCEVIFTASEEAIFVQFLLQRKRVRTLSIDDMHAALKLHADGADVGVRQSVVVAPHGLSGQLTGCCAGDLVQELHESKMKAVNDHLANGLPLHMVSSSCHGTRAAHGLHAEVYFGHASNGNVCSAHAASIRGMKRSLHPETNVRRNGAVISDKEGDSLSKNDHGIERVLLYPPEAVLILLVSALPTRTYLKRCWMQSQAGTTWIEEELHADMAVASSCSSCRYRVQDTSRHEKPESIPNSTNMHKGVKSPSTKSSSSSSSSSGGSSFENSSSHGSSSSSGSDGEAGIGPGELEADAESLVMKGNILVGSKPGQVSSGQPADDGLDDMKGFEDIDVSGKWGHFGISQGEAPASKTTKKTSSSGGEVSNEGSKALQNRPDGLVSGMGLSPNMGVGTPKAASSQAGTPWDWPEDDRGLGMGIENDADILAEFGDFGDFFEDDGLGFGEPPGIAESQAMMFPLTDCVEGITSPGTGCLDFSDPMLLPILDIPVLEGLGQQPVLGKDISGFQKVLQESEKSPSLLPDDPNAALDSLPKVEAMILFAPGYDPVSFPRAQDGFQNSIFKSPYLPEARKAQLVGSGGLELYVYSATPPSSPKLEGFGRKREYYENVSDRELRNAKRIKVGSGLSYMKGRIYVTGRMALDICSPLGGKASNIQESRGPPWPESAGLVYGQKASDYNILRRFPFTTLATDFACFMLQLSVIQCRDRKRPSLVLTKCSLQSVKERSSDVMYGSDASIHVKLGSKQHQDKRRKERISSGIAGDIDEEGHDGSRVSEVGVWHPIGASKPQRQSHASWNDNFQTSSVITSAESGMDSNQETASLSMRLNQWQSILDAIPLLVQQGAVSFDAAFDGDCGDGPFGWLVSQEQERRKSVCGPCLSHAGCGGMLCASHFLDNAGVELLDPLACEISAASVATILQSDIRVAMATAFGDAHLDGPLSLGEWLKGRAVLGDSLVSENLPSDLKETASTGIASVGEPITPPQCTTGGALGLKISVQDVESQACDGHRSSSSWAMEGSSLSDDGCTRRCGQETVSIESDAQPSCCRWGPTVMALPMPSLLVGYQDDWLKISSSPLHLWEKAPLEPYATAKPVTYYVLCPRIDPLLCATADYLQQLSTVYEACRLGTHAAGNMAFGQTGFSSSTGKHSFSGFMAIDFPNQASPAHLHSNAASSVSDYVTSISKTWNRHEFRKSLRKTCMALPISARMAVQREPENGPCLVYYIVCPSSDPDAVLQTMIDGCQSIGHNVSISDKDQKGTQSQTQRAYGAPTVVDDYSTVSTHGVVGFSTPKLVLQVLTAETILKSSSPISVDVNSLKEVAFTVYNKIRRIPRAPSSNDYSLHTTQGSRGRPVGLQNSTAMPSMWKDCGTGRSSGASTALLAQDSLLESGTFRSNSWDNPWQHQGTASDTSLSAGADGQMCQEVSRYLFEPLFILAEPGSLDHGVQFSESRSGGRDDSSGSAHSGLSDTIPGTAADGGSEYDIAGGGSQKAINLHCCYGWTEDWQWLISVWTDARGELLDVHLFPMVDTKGLQNLFAQILSHGCQLLLMAAGTGTGKSRSIVITRIGTFYELECQEWQKAIFFVGGIEVTKWPVQIWHQSSDSCAGESGSSLQPQDVNILAERTMMLGSSMPSSPGPSASVFGSRSKPSNFVKTDIGSSTPRKQGGGGHGLYDAWRGAFQLVQSISFANVVLDHSLQLVGLIDAGLQSGGSPNVLSSSVWSGSNNANVLTALGTGIGLVKTLASTSASYLFVPAHGLRHISPPLQLPAFCTSESPCIEQQLQKSGFASTVASAFIVSRATPSIRAESMQKFTEQWPSTLYVGLVGHMGNSPYPNMQQGPSNTLGNDSALKSKVVKLPHPEVRDQGAEAHFVLEGVAAELQALSWLTVSPVFPFRRTALPFHCDVVQRLRRLLHYANNELGGLHDR